MNKDSKIYVAGHKGMVGSAIVRRLSELGFNNLIYKTSDELDLRDQSAVEHFFESNKPEYVFLSAAKVGGIMANNTYRGAFIYDNLMIQSNVIHQSYMHNVTKLLFLGSSCIYPKNADQPLKEDYLLTGKLEPTNEPYAIAKISGIKMCDAYRDQYGCNFISAMPTNLYGTNDNYHLQNSHVIPALIRKFLEARSNNSPSVEIWGSGAPRREFMHVDDLADACVFLMNNYDDPGFVNIGVGEDISIKDLAIKIKEATAYEGELTYDTTKPDGTMRKLLDVTRLNKLGWNHNISLSEGISRTIREVESTKLQSNWS